MVVGLYTSLLLVDGIFLNTFVRIEVTILLAANDGLGWGLPLSMECEYRNAYS